VPDGVGPNGSPDGPERGAPGADPDPVSRQSEPEKGAGTDQWLAPLFTDSTLWPVVIVVAGCLSTLGAAVLVATLYNRNPITAAALLGLGWISFDVCRQHRRESGRLGYLGWSIVSLWGLSAAIGAIAILFGLA